MLGFPRRKLIYFLNTGKNCKINSFMNKNKLNWNAIIEFSFNWLDNWIVHCNTTKTNWAVRCVNPPLWSINLTCTISWLKKLAFYYYMPSRDVLKMVLTIGSKEMRGTSKLTLHLSTLCSSAHFAPRNTLLPGTLYSLRNTLLPGTLCFKCSREQRMLRRTIYKLAKCSREQSIPRSRVFQEAMCAEKQSVLGSKVFQGEKCSRKQTVLRGKVFQGAKCVE